MSATVSNHRQRYEKLAKIVGQFQYIMQMILKENITPKGLKAKYTIKPPRVSLTDEEIILLKELPNIDNFTVDLCYKILRLENIIDEPKSVTRETKTEIGYEINRIICRKEQLHSKDINGITEEYYKEFTNEVTIIAKRFDAYLAHGQNLYEIVSRCMDPGQDMRNLSVKENCIQRDRISRIGWVVLKKFPCFLQDIITKYCSLNPIYQSKELKTLESKDITALYNLLRNKFQIEEPTNGWWEPPGANDTTISDDIERIRRYRNRFAHCRNEDIGEDNYEDYFAEFSQIGQRIDVYLGNRKRRRNSYKAECEREVLECKTCHMDYNLQVKYERALKELENVKLQFQSGGILFYYGDTFDKSLNRLRHLLGQKLVKGTEKIRIQIILENVKDKSEAVRMLNVMRKEINKDLTDVEFIEASLGSIVLFVEISADNLRTDPLLQSLIIQFMERLLSLNIMKMDSTVHIDVLLVSIEEYSENKSVMALPLVCLEFEVEANIFETDKDMQEKLCKTVTHLLDRSNEKRQEKEITATLLLLSEGKSETDFSEENIFPIYTSRKRSLFDGKKDSGTSKTVYKEEDVIKKPHGISSDIKYKEVETDKRADIKMSVELSPFPQTKYLN